MQQRLEKLSRVLRAFRVPLSVEGMMMELCTANPSALSGELALIPRGLVASWLSLSAADQANPDRVHAEMLFYIGGILDTPYRLETERGWFEAHLLKTASVPRTSNFIEFQLSDELLELMH